MLNGSHLGITIHPNHVCGTIWTTNGVEQLFAKIDRNSLSEDDAIECSFKVDNENKTTLDTNKASGKAKLKAGEALTDAEVSALFGD